MQSFNVTQLTLEPLEKLWLKLPNYTMESYKLLKEHIQQTDEN